MTTPIPLAPPLAMTTASPNPPSPRPPTDTFPLPTLTLHFTSLSHPGLTRILPYTPTLSTILTTAIQSVCAHLYTSPSFGTCPKIKSLDLHIRPMGGVAYTTGTKHTKEIHLSADYIAGLPGHPTPTTPSASGPASVDADPAWWTEIVGVIRHEMVHVYQYNGLGTCPGGLIEGIADLVRLRDGLAPPHWKRAGGKWDDGYSTTAYFLEWVEGREGCKGFVGALNGRMGEGEYQRRWWRELAGGKRVGELWGEYCKFFGIDDESGDDEGEDSDGEGEHPGEGDGVHEGNRDGDGKSEEADGDLVLVEAEAEKEKESDATSSHSTEARSVGSSAGSERTGMRSTALSKIFRKRLERLTFAGHQDGRRFVEEFEALVEKALPGVEEEDKKLLLVTSFIGDEVADWLEEVECDHDNNVPYYELKRLLEERWVGKVRRRRMLES